MPTEEVSALQVELRHLPTARHPINNPRADEPGPRSPEVARRPGERNRIADVFFAPLRSPGVGKLDGAGPFYIGSPKHPNSNGGIFAVAATPGGGKADTDLQPPILRSVPHVQAQAVVRAVLGAKAVVPTRSPTAHYLTSRACEGESIPLFAEIVS